MHADNDLKRIAAVSDQIRLLGRQAFLMQLHATNAMVSTRSTGASVPGFEVVAQQMRELSHALSACLGALRGAMAHWLQAASQRSAHERSVAMVALAVEGSAAGARVAKPILARLRNAEASRAGVAALRAFTAVLEEARQLAATGCIIARTAKLEATYGGAIADQLGDSAKAFTELADSVDDSVRTIARRVAERRWTTA